MGSPGRSEESTYKEGYLVQSLGWEDPLAKGMDTHLSMLAWIIPRTAELGGL